MQGFNHPNVSAWLVANIDGVEAPFDVSLIAGGRVIMSR